jgi:hypothetical protein
MTYHLRRLRLHGLIERVPKTHRYRVTDAGWRTMLFCTRCYNRLLRPDLAEIAPNQKAAPRTLNRTVDRATVAIDAWINEQMTAA